LTELREDITPDAEDEWCPGGPSWCIGGHDDDDPAPVHETEFDGPRGIEADTDVTTRLVQEGSGTPVIELGVNDADGDSALIRLSLDQASELVEFLTRLLTEAELG
jgi:hypothetical protein